uniref:Putative nuclease HARBI1 n=1 Tax=Echeneis naucrates TaxID=173247 RepID=A0A665X2M2_ECHNA
MAAVTVARRRNRNNERRRRQIFLVHISIFGMTEEKVIQTYPYLEPTTRRSHAIPAMTKLLAALHFFASGSFQRTVAISAGVSQSSLPGMLSDVLNAMIRRMGRYIQFPSTQEALNETKHGFYAVADFPRVIEVVHCTHVQIVPPSNIEHVYRNGKHSHSLNAQAVCDSRGVITNVVAKYPGSVHDSFIMRNSRIFSKLGEGEYGDGWLLGDSPHPLHPFLLTPQLNPTTPGENRHNVAHIRTRNIVEKSWFRCCFPNQCSGCEGEVKSGIQCTGLYGLRVR